MALPKLDDEDLAKLHSEVNQYINHRFVIATTAITIAGVVLGWIVTGRSSGSGSSGQAPQDREVAFFSRMANLTGEAQESTNFYGKCSRLLAVCATK